MSDWYSRKRIDETRALYRMIIGERSNGKTYDVFKKQSIENFVKNRKQTAYIRRFDDDFKKGRGAKMFNDLQKDGFIKKITRNVWDRVVYRSNAWYLARLTENGATEHDVDPFAYGYALTQMEHDKGASEPDINIIVFDEFLSRGYYLPDEFVLFQNVLSSIIRTRDDVVIYMLANTVNKSAPYFKEMGLTHIKDLKQGEIDVYNLDDGTPQIAIEYCSPVKAKSKKNSSYFLFDNPHLDMIRNGGWEMAIYPHCPMKFNKENIKLSYIIEFEGELLQGDIVAVDGVSFTFIHRKTTPIQDETKDIIFRTTKTPLKNQRTNILRPPANSRVFQKISQYFKNGEVYFQDNEVGEIIRNYTLWCNQEHMLTIT